MDQETHKAITVLVAPCEGDTRYLTVCDKRWDDWTFVTGGCRKREIGWPIRTALRELEEETRGVIAISEGAYRYFYFEYAENEGIIYHVFVIETYIPRETQLTMIEKFNRERKLQKNASEIASPSVGPMMKTSICLLIPWKNFSARTSGLSSRIRC